MTNAPSANEVIGHLSHRKYVAQMLEECLQDQEFTKSSEQDKLHPESKRPLLFINRPEERERAHNEDICHRDMRKREKSQTNIIQPLRKRAGEDN